MDTVYILKLVTKHESHQILGVFVSEEKSVDYKKLYEKENTLHSDQFFNIEVWPIISDDSKLTYEISVIHTKEYTPEDTIVI